VISIFSIAMTNPLTVTYYANGTHDYAYVGIHVIGTLEKGEYEV